MCKCKSLCSKNEKVNKSKCSRRSVVLNKENLENSNGIVRKDLPKSTDLSIYSQEELNIIASKWNSIPRKSLNYQTPNEVIKKATGFESLLPVA
jgi:IS30 family transposase